MSASLGEFTSARPIRDGVCMHHPQYGDIYFNNEQFVCFLEAVRYTVKFHDEYPDEQSTLKRAIRPSYIEYGKYQFDLTHPWEVDFKARLISDLEKFEGLLGFAYIENEAIPRISYNHPLRDHLVYVRRRMMMHMESAFVFRQSSDRQWIEIGHVRKMLEDNTNDVYDDIMPYTPLTPFMAATSDLLGGVTETSSLPLTGYKLLLECGLGSITLGQPMKTDLAELQKKLMKQ
ncbi:hypothetical protein pEaSNUABM9_00295 [Erwinia phage pEa_SNUABM_9]|nr:hypothetical protein pEaSNUABM9_00295 [Erwinia phage pEa_SNUABM_9]